MKLEVLVADDRAKDYLESFQKAFSSRVNFTPVDSEGKAVEAYIPGNNSGLVIIRDSPKMNAYGVFIKMRAKEKDSEQNPTPIIVFSDDWDPKLSGQFRSFGYTSSEGNLAIIIAKMIGMDKETYNHEVKRHFDP